MAQQLRWAWFALAAFLGLVSCSFLLNRHELDVFDHSREFFSSESPDASCSAPPKTLNIKDLPYRDYFYSDCRSASQVVVTSPQPDSNLTFIGPRFLVAWTPGNSGVVTFFRPSNGINGTLAIGLKKPAGSDEYLKPIYTPAGPHSSRNDPFNGISGVLNFNSSAILQLPILGSIRTIRDFTEGPSILVPEIQNAIKIKPLDGGGIMLTRLWLDNITTTYLSFTPVNGAHAVKINGRHAEFGKGDYSFKAAFNYPQLRQFTASSVLNSASQGLITQQPDRVKSLTFLSYRSKLLAGAWRFLTYFGRDSMISLLLMQPILSTGEGGAIETVIGAVLERINHTTGIVCHEETIGDYATYLNEMVGKYSTQPSCSYIMVDPTYYLPVVMNNYFVLTREGRTRTKAFFDQKVTLNFGSRGLKYTEQALKNAESIMIHAKHFAAKGNQTERNLRHLEPGQIVGDWRDSTYGIGGGRIPYDINTGLVPAALRAIASLSSAGFYPQYPEWAELAAAYAQVWEDKTLPFFEVHVPRAEAQSLVRNYVRESGFQGPANVSRLTHDLTFHGLALNGNDNTKTVRVMNTDTAFRLFLLNTTDDTQLTPLLSQTAAQILRPFPLGLSTDVGLVVANPAYGGAPVYAANWTTADYQGTVVWGWPMAMMAKGLEYQLGRCTGAAAAPAFCSNARVFALVKEAYNHLWDLIESNRPLLTQEVWSWKYDTAAHKFKEVGLGTLSETESDVRQLWSLTYLAVTRNEAFK